MRPALYAQAVESYCGYLNLINFSTPTHEKLAYTPKITRNSSDVLDKMPW